MNRRRLIMTSIPIVLFISISILQDETLGETARDAIIDSRTRAAVVEEVGKLLMEKYVFLDVAEKLKDFIDNKLENGGYDAFDDPNRFAMALVEDLYQISGDRHFYIEFNPQRAELVRAQRSQSDEEKKAGERQRYEDDRGTNFGFKKLEHLKGNVGYLDLEFFSNAEYAGETAVAAMNFLANADAVIIDLRDTPGGYPNMVQLLCSYFIKGTREGRTHLNTFERRFDDSIEQFWTISYVPGRRMYDMDLYILTSRFTGSGAEEFTYNMKNLNRATVIGETTGGAAHHVEDVVIEDVFVMHLPSGRPINPISKTNWEGTGVEPHVTVEADKALDTAYLMILKKLIEETADEGKLFDINWAMDAVKARLDPVTLDENTLGRYVGTYGQRKILMENGELFYRRTGPQYRLISLKEDLFALEGVDHFRIEFVVDQSGRAVEMIGHYDIGMEDRSVRTE
jgi:hypothetical protein